MRKDVEQAFKHMCRNLDLRCGKGTTEGWTMETWSPGDGWTRYRIAKSDGFRLWGTANDNHNHRDILVAMNFLIDVVATVEIEEREKETQ